MKPDDSPHALADRLMRTVTYLRLSVTDRCNLRCLYCRGLGDEHVLGHREILSYEEIMRLVRLVVGLGVHKVRLTGGEPFVRRDFARLLLCLRNAHPFLNLRVTTNGTLLAPYLPTLLEGRINAVNVSLDSLNRATFARITGMDMLSRVVGVIEELLAGGIRVKINAVAMRGVTDVELPSFVDAIRRWPVDVRFIEFMPMGARTLWRRDSFLSAADLLREISKNVELTPIENLSPDRGPARMFRVEGAKGRIGIISGLSNHFCDTCNRLRITSDGNLRTCLFGDNMVPLRDLLRDPKVTDQDVENVFREALKVKPVGVDLLREKTSTAVAATRMDSIGG